MTFIEDLAPCTYLDRSGELSLVAVGWLSSSAPYTTGLVRMDVHRQLRAFFAVPSRHFLFMGRHPCDFCNTSPSGRPQPGTPLGLFNLVVPSARRLYACPELIMHYIDAHGYAPPLEFCNAVLACPSPLTPAYYEILFATGGAPWEAMFERPPLDFEPDSYKLGHRTLQQWRARGAT